MGDQHQSRDILRLAAGLPREAVNKAAHALGWPSIRAMREGWRIVCGPVRWRNPYRNYYCGSTEDRHWLELQEKALAEHKKPNFPVAGDTYWWLTALGIAVIRARLQTAKEAAGLPRETVCLPPETEKGE